MSKIQYVDQLNQIHEEQLVGFFVGWVKPLTPQEHYKLLKNSSLVVLAIDSTTNQVVGFITALTDWVSSSFIPLLEVLQDYQRKGIGSMLVEIMLAKLENIPNIDLMCDPDVQPFYDRFKMMKSSGMVIRKYLRNE